MANTLDIYEVGTRVKLNDDNLEAKIITVAIHASNVVQYECAWWSGEARVRDWFAEDDILEIIDGNENKNKIGFHNG
jgi:uncharacterized protein YodC (DUF2158 family)|tara:strand:- start:219 stop:449 length:231 start_codon:yes stop_codon:yes gene_type:complete